MGKLALLLFIISSLAAGHFERRPLYQRQLFTGDGRGYEVHQIRPCVFENGAPIDVKIDWNKTLPLTYQQALADNEKKALDLLQYLEQFEEKIALDMQYIAASSEFHPPPNVTRTVTWITPLGRQKEVIGMLSLNFRPTFIHQLLTQHGQPPLPNLSPPIWLHLPDLYFENPGRTGYRFFSHEYGGWIAPKVSRRWRGGPTIEVQSYFLHPRNSDDFSLLLNQLSIPEARFSLEEIPGWENTEYDNLEIARIISEEGEVSARYQLAPWVVPFQRVAHLVAWTVLPVLDRQYANLYKFKRHAQFIDERFLVKKVRDGTVYVLTTPTQDFEFATWESLKQRRERARTLVKRGKLDPAIAGEVDGHSYQVTFLPLDQVFAKRYLDSIRPQIPELAQQARDKACRDLILQLGNGDIRLGVERYRNMFE
jgi:hypothetical protein